MIDKIQFTPQKLAEIRIHVCGRFRHLMRQPNVQIHFSQFVVDVCCHIGVDGNIVVDGTLHLLPQMDENHPHQFVSDIDTFANKRFAAVRSLVVGAAGIVEQLL